MREVIFNNCFVSSTRTRLRKITALAARVTGSVLLLWALKKQVWIYLELSAILSSTKLRRGRRWLRSRTLRTCSSVLSVSLFSERGRREERRSCERRWLRLGFARSAVIFGLFSSDLVANKPLIFRNTLANKEGHLVYASTGVGAASEIESAIYCTFKPLVVQ